jgi:integrase
MRKPSERLKFTVQDLARLPVPASGRVVVHDLHCPDLALRISASGQRSFFWFKKVAGRPTFRSIGPMSTMSIAAARQAAIRFSAEMTCVRVDINTNDGMTVGELLAAYVEQHVRIHAKRPERAVRSIQGVFNKLDVWRDRRLSEIRRRDVADLHRHVGETHGKVAANRLLSFLRAAISFGQRAELWQGANPAEHIPRFRERSRERFLDADELRRLFAALEQEPSRDLADFVKLALMTGARKSDLFSMAWADISLDGAVWRVPDTTKVEPYQVALPPPAVEILKARCNTGIKSSWVFQGRHGHGHLVDLKKSWAALLCRAGIQDLHVHDLRRSHASWMLASGANLVEVARSLGHKNLATVQVYARSDLRAVRGAVEKATAAMLAAAQPGVMGGCSMK